MECDKCLNAEALYPKKDMMVRDQVINWNQDDDDNLTSRVDENPILDTHLHRVSCW